MRKEFANHSARKHQPTSWRISKHCTLKYRQSPRPQKDKFPQRLLWSRRRRATTALSCNIQMKLWEKANIGGFRHHNYVLWLHSPIDGSVRKKTNYLLHFRVLNLKDFFMIPAMMGSQDIMNGPSKTQQVSFIFGCSKRFPDFKTAVYFLYLNADLS